MVKTIPESITNHLIALIKAFPQYRFIWRNGVKPLDTPDNAMVTTWIPQVDLVSDIRTRLFISHCGNHGTHESLFKGAPILGIPLMFDQFYIAKRVQGKIFAYTEGRRTNLFAISLIFPFIILSRFPDRLTMIKSIPHIICLDIGAGVMILPYEVTGKKLVQLVNTALTTKYLEKARELQMKMEKMPINDLELAVSNIEYLIEIGNFDHLKSNIVNQSFIEYNNLVVYCVLMMFFILVLLITIRIFMMLYKKIWKGQNTKTKKE